MARIRTVAAGAIALAFGAALVTGPATAAEIKSGTPESFLGQASGRALNISVLGRGLTLGGSAAQAALDPAAEAAKKFTASATGSGQLAVLASTVESAADLATPESIGAEKCAQVINLPSNLASAGLACGVSSARVANDLPSALSEGRVAGLNVSLNNVLATLPIGTVLDTVLTTVGGLTPDALDPVTTTVDQLLTSVLNTKTLEVTVGKSTSSVISEAGKVTSAATASGAEIKILPTPVLGDLGVQTEPVATITVSSSAAKAVYERGSGVATPSFDAALVTVRVAPPLTDLLGGGVTELKVAPGETVTILEGTPLESTIVVADGVVTRAADGTVKAVADGVKLDLLKGLGQTTGLGTGGVVLELAHSEASIKGAVPTQVLGEQIRAVPTELPRTGGGADLPMIGGGLFIAALATRRLFNRFAS